MKAKSIISDLHLKFAERTWKDTFQLVRRCMEKSRDESKPCEPLVRSLERLQEEFNVSSMNTMRSRLEMIAKQQGMGFHVTEATCYLTADLFYLEVVLEPHGGVEEVKVAPQGGAPVSSESLLQLLRLKKFADFSMSLAALFTQYNMPGDNEIKLKLFTSLQYLWKDLQQISQLPRAPKDGDPQIDMINNGRIGSLIAGKEDCPLTIRFFIAPTDVKKTESQTTDMKAGVQAAQVTVGVSDVPHKLQMASVIPQPQQLDPRGFPVFLPPNEVPNETLPACFLLKLQPAVPVILSFVNKLSQITDVTIPDDDLQWAPLPKLLMRGSQSANSHGETSDEQDTIFTVPLPGGVMHSYILPGAAWQAPAQRGTVMDSVPFTRPAHVPAILDLLRHQCVINTLLRSCVSSQCAGPGSVCDLHFEVLPESDTSFSVTFHQPNTDSLAVLLVNVSDSHQITCSLFGAGGCDPSMGEYISTVMKRCMSVPVTLRTLYSKLEEITCAPLSPPARPAATEAENERSPPSSTAVTDARSASTELSQAAAVPEDGCGVSGSACYAMSVADSELPPEINTSPAVNPYPFTAVGVFSH
ncbi:mediator of RNA polymerase II transcription subunit 1-like isoform X1 [Seriola lalandi dorsalis]|uniref:mediator of RNA polymerase II transcription subunit 1-like isoform X1 n=1 Tax=Seriola lalandi dorsalis TaxID=1841481 RepID=UPI000C6F5A5F|nr:mediator of RNA polymerase II transcription subunit 1-like isoform X1 [Seriola lalandi dorsalis]